MQNFQALEAPPPNPQNSPPPNCGFLATRVPHFAMFTIMRGFRSFCLEQFFLDRSVANLMMLTRDKVLFALRTV